MRSPSFNCIGKRRSSGGDGGNGICLSASVGLPERITRRHLDRVPRRRLECGAGRARRRMFHAGHVKAGAPAALVVLGQLQIEALAVHPDRDVADARPGVEPRPKCREGIVAGRMRERSEADGCL
jgi:hypothetical protein